MKRLLHWIWNRGIVSTFLSGLFAILPIVITVVIVTWLIGYLRSWLGPDSSVGRALQALGLRVVTDETTATVIGWVVVLVGVWLIGLLTKAQTRQRIEKWINAVVRRIPIVKGVYGTAAQVVGMLHREDQSELRSMSVVFCSFGQERGGGFLALLASSEIYRFQGRDCRVVYIPTSPLPMSGGIVFVPLDAVTSVEMSAENLMQIYFSLGVLTGQVIPEQYRAVEPA